MYNISSEGDSVDSVETCCSWGVQAAGYDAPQWNKQGQQDAAV